ncbi:putative tail tip protein [Escherichia phage ZCEC10]|uniref:putative tail tip protein n=1 Tax=Escherichia phage ZCEC10 TaxID=2894588 RepID=UPI00240DFB65|nr:putative tail tip protein [Escherichia phage ZCEC10]UJQ88016.1 putative tail tip protein [Escherichia phage ZCEC10]
MSFSIAPLNQECNQFYEDSAMAAGTLSVTNNSKAVVGAGTTFTAFTAGDFLTLVVGQVPYTVAISSVESDTALTLVLPFDGPTATGLAWDGVKRDTMSLATMGVTVQAQKALRLMIADENNWRAIFGDAEEITVTLPNGQVMQGMSWGYLSSLMKEVDPVEMRNLQQQAAASEAAAQGFRNEAEGFKTETAGIRDATNQIKADTQAVHDATNTIKTQTDQIKSDTQAIKDQTNQIKTDTGVIRDEANTAKTDAQAARDAARGFRDQAEEWAQSVNPDNLLTKSGNLAGLADKSASWANLMPSGPLRVGADPIEDLDAATKRWTLALLDAGTANTSWSVKNADGSAPPLGTVVRGGEVVSEYSNPTATQFARLYSSSVFGSSVGAVVESQGADVHQFRFYENGNMDFRKSGHGNALGMYSAQVAWDSILRAGPSDLVTGGVDRVSEGAGSDIVLLGYSLGAAGPTGYPTKVGFHQYMPGSPAFGSAVITVGGDNNFWSRYFFDITGQIYGATNNGEFSYARNGVSDERVKHDIAPVGVEKSYSNIRGLEFVKFVYNNDEQERVRHGVIAQQAETVEPLYVKTRKYVGINPGEVVEQKELDTTPMLLDTMHVVQTLMQKIEAMEAEIAALKK